jgi:hypothetical protein
MDAGFAGVLGEVGYLAERGVGSGNALDFPCVWVVGRRSLGTRILGGHQEAQT